MTAPQLAALPEHQAPDDEPAVCWLLDVRAYGLNTATAMHPIEQAGDLAGEESR